MEIDPRLRSDSSVAPLYNAQLHRNSTSAQPQALAPNPSHHSLPLPYHSGHDTAHHTVGSPHTSLSVSSSSPTDQLRPARGGSPDDGGANDPKRPRACEACRGLKVRCELDQNNPNGPCKRCAKARRNCVVTLPSRKRQKKTDSRVAELEKKIDALTASLHATKSGPSLVGQRGSPEGDRQTPNAAPRPNQYEQATNGNHTAPFEGRNRSGSWASTERYTRTSEPDGRPAPPPMVIAGQKRKFQDGRDNAASTPGSTSTPQSDQTNRANSYSSCHLVENPPNHKSTISNQYTDVVDRGVVDMERATAMFNRYVNEMALHMPVVVFPPDTTAADIRKTKPTLFLAILCAGSSTDPSETQRVLTKEVMQIYAERVICNGEKTLELVQALLVSTIWYWPPEHLEELKFYQLTHIAAIMALDININKKSKVAKSKTGGNPGLWRDHPWRRIPFPEADAIDARRTWLGCYIICCATSMGLRRPNLIRWTPYMAECIEVLETSSDAAATDKFLAQWARLQHIGEEVGVQFSMDDPSATANIADPKVQYALKGFERDLEHWSQQVPKSVRTPTLKMAENVVNIYMHEVAMHVDHNVEEFKPPFTEESLRGSGIREGDDSTPLSADHIAALSTCLTSIDGVFEAFLSMDVEAIRALPILYFVRIAYSVVVLIKMYFAAAKPNSEFGKVINKDNMKVEEYLDGLLETFRATAADEKSRPAAKFLMVLAMLKTWFHRSKTGIRHPEGAGQYPAAPNADVDTPSQTPGPSGPTTNQQSINPHQHLEYSPASTPLHLLSEVAAGSTSRPESRNQYGSSEWPQNQPPVSQQQQQQQQQQQPPPPPPYNYAETNVTGALPTGYSLMYGPSSSMDPAIGFRGDFDFRADGLEQAMGMTLGDGDFGRYFQDDSLWNAMMEGGSAIFESV